MSGHDPTIIYRAKVQAYRVTWVVFLTNSLIQHSEKISNSRTPASPLPKKKPESKNPTKESQPPLRPTPPSYNKITQHLTSPHLPPSVLTRLPNPPSALISASSNALCATLRSLKLLPMLGVPSLVPAVVVTF